MKIGFKLSVAIAAAALTLGIGSAAAESRCTPCYTAYQACLATGTSDDFCYPPFARCLRNSGCTVP